MMAMEWEVTPESSLAELDSAQSSTYVAGPRQDQRKSGQRLLVG